MEEAHDVLLKDVHMEQLINQINVKVMEEENDVLLNHVIYLR